MQRTAILLAFLALETLAQASEIQTSSSPTSTASTEATSYPSSLRKVPTGTADSSSPSQAAGPNVANNSTQGWTASTSAKIRYVLSRDGDDQWGYKQEPNPMRAEVLSPDGKYFFFITERGDLECDCNIQEMLVYATHDVMRGLARRVSAIQAHSRVEMRYKYKAIQRAHWIDGGKAIEFLGRKAPNFGLSLHRLHMDTGTLETVVDVPPDVDLVDYESVSDALIYTLRSSKKTPSPYPIYALTPDRVNSLLTLSGADRDISSFAGATYVSYRERAPWKLSSGHIFGGGPWLSPDGKKAVIVRRPTVIPQSWAAYDGMTLASESGTAKELIGQYFLIDLENGTERPLLSSPTAQVIANHNLWDAPQAFWSSDGSQVVLTDVALPIDGTDEGRRKTAYVIAYKLSDGTWDALQSYQGSAGSRIASVSWVVPGHRILVEHSDMTVSRYGKPIAGQTYTFDGKTWVREVVGPDVKRIPPWKLAPYPKLPKGLSIDLRQDMNTAPRMVASFRGNEVTLMDEDPELRGVSLALTERLSWRDSQGTPHESGLTLPQAVAQRKKNIPLVVQFGAFQPWLFRPDGPVRGHSAAQNLATRQIAVLNLNAPLLEKFDDLFSEMPKIQDWLDLAVAEVARKYPIDTTKVGIFGFSRTGFQVRYSITFPKRIKPAAAIIADSNPGSYISVQALYAGGSEHASEYGPIYANGKEFYAAKSEWLAHEVDFNVDQVRTPTLFVDNSDTVANTFGTIGAFTQTRRPFEYQILLDGHHQPVAPQTRAAGVQIDVDWMAFWLNGELPSDQERAARWTKIRHDWQRQQAWEAAGHRVGSIPDQNFNISSFGTSE